jgi:hypothetical protein
MQAPAEPRNGLRNILSLLAWRREEGKEEKEEEEEEKKKKKKKKKTYNIPQLRLL